MGDSRLLWVEEPTKQGGWDDCERLGGCNVMQVAFDASAVQFLSLRSVLDNVLGVSAVRWTGSLWTDVVASVFYAAARDERDNTLLYVSVDGGEQWQRCSFDGFVKAGNFSDGRHQHLHYTPLAADDFVLFVALTDPEGARGNSESTLFVADAGAPARFRRSLDRVKSTQTSLLYGYVDFEQLQGIDGCAAHCWFDRSIGRSIDRSID